MYFWLYPVFEAVGYGEIQRDTARYSRYSWIQLDTYEYSWIQWDIAGYSGSAAEWLDTGIQRDTKDMVRYRQDTGEIQAGDSKNTRQGRASSSSV